MSLVPTSQSILEQVDRSTEVFLHAPSVSRLAMKVSCRRLTRHFLPISVPGSRIAMKAQTAPAWKVWGKHQHPHHLEWPLIWEEAEEGSVTHPIWDRPPYPEHASFSLESCFVCCQDGVGGVHHYLLRLGVRLWIESKIRPMQDDPGDYQPLSVASSKSHAIESERGVKESMTYSKIMVFIQSIKL